MDRGGDEDRPGGSANTKVHVPAVKLLYNLEPGGLLAENLPMQMPLVVRVSVAPTSGSGDHDNFTNPSALHRSEPTPL
jgi:hypothetical protein